MLFVVLYPLICIFVIQYHKCLLICVFNSLCLQSVFIKSRNEQIKRAIFILFLYKINIKYLWLDGGFKTHTGS